MAFRALRLSNQIIFFKILSKANLWDSSIYALNPFLPQYPHGLKMQILKSKIKAQNQIKASVQKGFLSKF